MLVMEGGLNPEYVLDKMEQYEIEPLIHNLQLKNKESWEQTRLIAYITAQVNSTKKLKPTDIIIFPWEKVEPNKNVSFSNEDGERLNRMAQQIINKKYGK